MPVRKATETLRLPNHYHVDIAAEAYKTKEGRRSKRAGYAGRLSDRQNQSASAAPTKAIHKGPGHSILEHKLFLEGMNNKSIGHWENPHRGFASKFK